jgi:hypothetical protein
MSEEFLKVNAVYVGRDAEGDPTGTFFKYAGLDQYGHRFDTVNNFDGKPISLHYSSEVPPDEFKLLFEKSDKKVNLNVE